MTLPVSRDTRSRIIAFWSDRHVWKVASQNTLNCLIGCSIGDFGMIVFLQAFYPATPMWLTMVLAMSAGLVTSVMFESTLLRIKQGFAWGAAIKTALSMSFLSMLGMEFASNATDFMLTGGRVPLGDPMYWVALGFHSRLVLSHRSRTITTSSRTMGNNATEPGKDAALADQLLKHHDAFLAFVRKRIADPNSRRTCCRTACSRPSARRARSVNGRTCSRGFTGSCVAPSSICIVTGQQTRGRWTDSDAK